MAKKWENTLDRWRNAGLIDAALATRIREFEAEQERSLGIRWPVLIAWSLGGLLLAAGVLLFVAAHWDEISPAARFAIALLMVAVLHAGGAAVAERSNLLASILHAVGTIALGAGIFLAGQIFHLEEHWPGGMMLWAAGAWMAWGLRRDWIQGFFAALLTPAWLAGEWLVAAEDLRGAERVFGEGMLLLSLTYASAMLFEKRDSLRRALFLVGGLGVLIFTFFVGIANAESGYGSGEVLQPGSLLWVAGWVVALAAPLGVAWWLRGPAALLNLVAAAWVVVLGSLNTDNAWQLFAFELWCAAGSVALVVWGIYEDHRERIQLGYIGLFLSYLALLIWAQEEKQLFVYLLCAAGAVGLVYWGVRAARRDAINVGVACFALTVGFFYFSTVMDKLGRSASLIGLGVLFLAGGWALERTRRRLVAGINRGPQ